MKGSAEWPGAQGRPEISPGTADVQGDPVQSDGTDDSLTSSADGGCSFLTLVGFSLFPLFVQESPGLDATTGMKMSRMSLRVCSLLSRRCRVFNNHLMTVIKNVSGFETAGSLTAIVFGWMRVRAVPRFVSFIRRDVKNVPCCFTDICPAVSGDQRQICCDHTHRLSSHQAVGGVSSRLGH